jgi:hypothetical protein
MISIIMLHIYETYELLFSSLFFMDFFNKEVNISIS